MSKIQPNLKDAKFQEQEQRMKYMGIDNTLDPRQGQGAKLVRQYLENTSEDPIFMFHYRN